MPERRINHWIGGKPWTGEPERTGEVYDPATGEVSGRVALAGVAEVDAAVAAAEQAWQTWRHVSLTRRVQILFAFREILNTRKQELAEVITSEHGKVVSDALGEVTRGLEVVEFACGAPHLLKGGFSEAVSTGVDTYSIRQPLGVVGIISPFNFPAMVPMWFFPLAIAAGNTVVLKPSEKDPSAAVLLAEMWAEAGLPDGIFNIVYGGREAVEAILAHPDIAALQFVGSTAVGRHVYQTGTANGKRVGAYTGAKNHMVVLPDADMELAADSAVSAGFGSAGERCMAIATVVAVGEAGDRLIPLIVERIGRLKVGPGMEPGVDMGPIYSAEHRASVIRWIEKGVAEGATLVHDGR
ncbi:MAG: CoA-acylating methylmalonate-semialdehyde dehydrogenase, partial [Actinomycetota bacterium]